jgi:hypothetical protein
MLQILQQMSAFAQKFGRALLPLWAPGEIAEPRIQFPRATKKAPASAGA